MYDVVIIGGGPAGVSAALVLGRSCRKVQVIDSGKPRNRFATQMQGFITRDGMDPMEFLRIAREELRRYPVEWHTGEARGVEHHDPGFLTSCIDGASYRSRKVLVATGVVDRLPGIDGIEGFYGDTVHHCPYCHGWEARDQPIAVYGRGKSGVTLSLCLKNWSDDITLFNDGGRRLARRYRNVLDANGIAVETGRILRLEGQGGKLEAVILEDGRRVGRTTMFFTTGHDPHCRIPEGLGCRVTKSGEALVNRKQETSVAGIYVAGDAALDMDLVIVAAAEGAKAAVSINTALQEEERIQAHPA